MLSYIVRLGLLLTLLALFLAGCASAGIASTPEAPTIAPPPPTSPSPATSVPVPTTASVPASTATSAASDSADNAGDASASDTVRLVVVPDKSKANYRVREQLANVSFPSDAVGSTSAITGTIVGKMDGTIISNESKFTVDLRTLKSDQAMRDGFLSRAVLETETYPYATFVPTSAPGLPKTLPPSGQGGFKLVGNLTVRNVTKEVTWDVTCQVTSDQTQATCHATTSFPFEYFNLTQPRVGRVLSIENHITLEMDVVLQRVTG